VQEATMEVQREKAQYQLAKSEISDKWAKAIFDGDEVARKDARDDVAAWNRDNPDQKMTADMPGILHRVREMRKSKVQRMGDTAPKAIRGQVRQQLKESMS